MRDQSYLIVLSLLALASALPFWLKRRQRYWLMGLGLYFGLSIPFALITAGIVSFTFMRLLSLVLFLGLPLYLLLTAWALPRFWKRFAWVWLTLTVLIGIDAFFIEPRWLTVSYHTISSPLIKKPMRIVSLADLQTDHIGAYERKALTKASTLQADLVVFPGDYIQEWEPSKRAKEVAAFRELLRDVKLEPRLGAFAVQGDMENKSWPELFVGTGVQALPKTTVLDLGELELAGLTLHDSRVGASLPSKKKYRVVVGHAPDFALRPTSADLLLAGHTHGGQVQVPFFGPLVTLSQVPRAWAGGGLVDLGQNRHLVVSRGIGHERGPAPRLRFNCRPEIVVIDLVPTALP